MKTAITPTREENFNEWYQNLIVAADLAENSFLELSESCLVYYAPSLLGSKVFKNVYSKGLNTEQQKNIVKPAAEFLKKQLSLSDKKLLRIKAAISLGCLAIPICEYALSYIKNLFTLGVFKTGDFNNIANLSKSKTNSDKRNEVFFLVAYVELNVVTQCG